MLLIARWLVKLIPFFDLIPLGYKNEENCKIAGKKFKIKYHVTHCSGIWCFANRIHDTSNPTGPTNVGPD